MNDKDPTSVIQMIKDLRSGSEAYRKSNNSVPVKLSGTTYTSVLDTDECIISPKRPKLSDSNNSNLNRSETENIPGSPWEWRRLKGEVISLKTRLSHQEAAVQQLHKIRRQMEEVFEKEKGILEIQVEQDKQTIKQLEVRLDISRRTIQDTREAQAAAEKELFEVKTNLEQKIMTLMNENAKLLGDFKHTSTQENKAVTKDFTDGFDTQSKLESAQTRIKQLEEKLKEYQIKQQELELQNVEFQAIKIKVERLESEKMQWEEGKMFTAKAAKANELEKELIIAKETIASLRESVRGKLLLEEQMSNVMKRLEHTERVEQQVAMLEAKKTELSLRLAEYESIGITGPSALKRELNRLQQAELVLKAEEGQLRSKLDAALRESHTLSKNYEDAKKLAMNVTVSKEKLNTYVGRLQKKMLLITRERDSYRQQLDLYEKEISIDSNNAITERIPALERTIDVYRDLVAKLESDLQAAEGYNQTEECNKLKEEVERLKGELEHRALKGDFNSNARVLHFTMNPAAIAEQQAEEKQKALLCELEELRAKVMQGGINATTSSLQAQEIAELKQTHEIKIARLKEAFKASSQEYRQACYQLFGWRVDRTKEGQYKLYSQYAESPDDFLFFKIGEEGVNLLETAFSATLGALVEQYLQQQHSVPMFLNAVQSDLFNQQTMTNILSVPS